MFGLVPAATQTVRAGRVTSAPSRVENFTAWTAPWPSATASTGDSPSAKTIPSSSALITSSWLSRYAGESFNVFRYAMVTPPHALTSRPKSGASLVPATRSRSARTARPCSSASA